MTSLKTFSLSTPSTHWIGQAQCDGDGDVSQVLDIVVQQCSPNDVTSNSNALIDPALWCLWQQNRGVERCEDERERVVVREQLEERWREGDESFFLNLT